MVKNCQEMLPTSTFFRHHPLLLFFLFFLALLYTFFYRLFAFLLASSPVLILTAFLLGVVLVYSDPDLPPEDDHAYNKISQVHCRTTTTRTRRQRFPRGSDSAASSDSDNPLAISTATSLTSFPDGGDDNDESESESEAEHLHPEEKHESEVVRVLAWTAEDDKCIENIGSLELEMNATVEKLMSRRRAGRQPHHADLDDTSKLSVHVTSRKNPFDLDVPHHEDDFPGSAPSMLYPSRNPFFDDSDNNEDDLHLHAPPPSSSLSSAPGKTGMVFRRHESFTVGAPFASDFRPSRFRPYFVTEKMQDQPVAIPQASGKSSSSSSSSSVGAGAANANKEGGAEAAAAAAAALADAAAAVLEVKTDEGGMVVAVDVELISDSSDEDMSLPAGDDEQEQKMQMKQQQEVAVSEDDGESFEVESIMKQVAAAAAGRSNQLVADPAYDYSPSSAGKLEKTEQAFDQAVAVEVAVPSIREEESSSASGGALAPPSKLASMRRVFHDQDETEDGAWVAPSKLASVEEKETREREVTDTLAPPLPPLAAPAAAPPLAAASLKEKAVGKSSRYKPPSKKAVLGFFRK